MKSYAERDIAGYVNAHDLAAFVLGQWPTRVMTHFLFTSNVFGS